MKPITITFGANRHGSLYFDVEQDGLICDGLAWDEMLGQVIALTFPTFRVKPGGQMYPMKTAEEWAAEHAYRFAGTTESASVAATAAGLGSGRSPAND